MTLRTTIFAIGFAVLLLFSGCGNDTTSNLPPVTSEPEEPVAPDTPAIANTVVTTIDGETINVKVTEDGFIFEGYEDKIVLLEVYGFNCPHCTAAIPVYNSLQARYQDDVVVISIEDYGISADQLRNGVAQQMQYRTIAKADSGDMKTYIESKVGPLGGVPYLLVLRPGGAIHTVRTPQDITEADIDNIIQQILPN